MTRSLFTTAIFLLAASAQAFQPSLLTIRQSTSVSMISPLDAMNNEINKQKSEEDDEVPMTKAEMRQAEKEMKAEMKRLKDEAAKKAKEE